MSWEFFSKGEGTLVRATTKKKDVGEYRLRKILPQEGPCLRLPHS